MKRLSIYILALLTTTWVSANPITMENAKLAAKDYLSKVGPVNLQEVQVKLAHRSSSFSSSLEEEVFIFNINETDGFIIVSGDDATVPVLGYCDHGHFDFDTAPENFIWWLDFYRESIQQIRECKESKPASPIQHARPTDVVPKLVKTTWNQDYPYNNLCPEYQGQRCPTGCLATALAQIMYYHKHPQDSCKALPSYYADGIKVNMPSLSPTVFDWESMKYHYGYNDSEESINAVAELMLYCGQILHMSYNPAGSGAREEGLVHDLPRYFNYPNTIHNVSRDQYSIEQWDELLLNELKHNRPVLYCGYTTSNEGHAFVCDGYNGEGLYHINWGWGGMADGDYRISVLDANASGIGGSTTSSRFSVGQSILVGIQAQGSDDFTPISPSVAITTRPSLMNGNYFERSSISEAFSNVKIGSYLMWTDEDGWNSNELVGYGLYDDSGELVSTLQQSNKFFWNGYPSDFISSSMNLGKGIDQGHYTIKPMVYEDNQWVSAFNADMYYINVEINGLSMTLSPVPKANFKVLAMAKKGKNLVFTLENPDEEFNGYMFVLKMNGQGSFEPISYERVSLEAGSTRELSIYLGDAKLNIDDDVFALSIDDLTQEYFYTNVYSQNSQLQSDITILNYKEEDNTVYGDNVYIRVDLSNYGSGHYHHFIQATLVDEAGIPRAGGYKQVKDLEEGEAMSFDIEVPINSYSEKYQIKMSYFDEHSKQVDIFTNLFQVAKGAYYWLADGEVRTLEAGATINVPESAVAINLRGAYTNDVRPNSNPNTVYLLDKSVPKSLKGKNIVNYERKSGNFTLTDGYDYLIPCAIKITNKITYQRSFGVSEVNRWTTICLPFTPTSITANGSSLEWFKNDSEQGKDLWLMSYDKVVGDKVYFTYAQDMLANTPYLLAVNASCQDQPVIFSAGNVDLAPTLLTSQVIGEDEEYYFQGFSTTDTFYGLYTIEGDRFVHTNDAAYSSPFRATLVNWFNNAQPVVYIEAADITDGITTLKEQNNQKRGSVFTIAGQRITSPTLRQGVYIIDGKKVVIK